MVYLDNAATGGFKPNSVFETSFTITKYLLANPGRSGHRLSVTGAQTVNKCRNLFSKCFSCSPDRVIFTKNCTEALNVAIFGTAQTGGHVITTTFEHNSVLRPLTALKNKGIIELDVVKPNKDGDIVEPIREKIKDNTYAVVVTAVSNVTGLVLPIKKIGDMLNKHGITFIVDGAQAGGHVELNMKDMHISLLALAGHKGLSGIMSCGVLLIDDGVHVEPLIYGGTGSESQNLNQPECYPERLESGTLNLPAIASLYEGLDFVKNNFTNFSAYLINQTDHVIEGLKKLSTVTVYSDPNPAGIVSFSCQKYSSEELSDILSSRFDIAVRGGLHCAPLTHKFLKTEKTGLVRASIAVQNSSRELNYFLSVLKKINDSKSF